MLALFVSFLLTVIIAGTFLLSVVLILKHLESRPPRKPPKFIVSLPEEFKITLNNPVAKGNQELMENYFKEMEKLEKDSATEMTNKYTDLNQAAMSVMNKYLGEDE